MQYLYLLGSLLVLVAHTLVLLCQLFVGLVERVNLHHIATHHGTHGLELLLEACNLGSIAGLGGAQLFEQLLSAELLALELSYQRVVADEYLHLIVLCSEGAILILHLLLLQLEELHHLLIGLIGLAETDAEESQCPDEEHGYGNYGDKNLLVHLCYLQFDNLLFTIYCAI